MKKFQLITHLATLLVAAALLASPSFALTVDLVAEEFTQNIDPDGPGPLPADPVVMWGFGLTPGTASAPGPRIIVPPEETLTINLTNNLPEPVSIVIPGQSATLTPERDGSGRVTSLTNTVAGSGGTGSYTWTGLKPGTFIYHSGSNLAKQVHMGLYGAMTADAATGEAYPGVAYDSEVVLFYSEIDPALHDPADFAHPNDYTPRYFLVNGEPYVSGAAPIFAGNVNETTLVRMFSTALDDLVPTLLGLRWALVAEDGNPYPYPRNQHTTLLSGLKTKDAVITPTNAGTFTVFDRRGNLTNDGVMPGGMMVKLQVGTAAGAPVANPDSATVVEGGTVAVLDSTAASVLANDVPSDPNDAMTAILVDNVANGTLTLNTDGTFSYTHNGSETAGDAFTYNTNDGTLDSNVATVSITITPVNDAPAAVDDAYEAVQGVLLEVAAPGLLANDSDPEDDSLTAADSGAPPAGLSLNPDGSFSYTPSGLAGAVETFDYVANDGEFNSAPATVTITVTTASPNQPPTAVNDFAETTRNTPVLINLVANDTDPDENLDPTSVDVLPTSAQGGTITNNGNGTVNFDPKRGFRGTDTFTYTVQDLENATSNAATVQVNVVKP